VLPGPEIVFRPVHQKSSANLEKGSANVTKKINAASAKGSI
jgi:hypothetical protein